MPAQFEELLAETACRDAFTDEDMVGLRQEITRDVVTELMFGPQQSERDRRRDTKGERAGVTLLSLSCKLLDTAGARGHLASFIDDRTDIQGALHFACLLNLAREQEEAIWWWQFAAGAGNLQAAYFLYLLYLSRGDMRDAEHWMRHFLGPAGDSTAFIPPPSWAHSLPKARLVLFSEAVHRLEVVEAAGIQLHQPDRRFFEQIADQLPPAEVRAPSDLPRRPTGFFPFRFLG
ncbi:hypothetical protein EJC51_46120 [Streptomyces aquilus]|uniref:Sel1 repeat family protein n=1 Tax=Streptomyces aquilus TaxID=2548456 RepID=A0A3S9IEN2_9ACTN|nr:hypothetical protein [Streptomyces aquilus]AZP22782.1 hypothetical protein EJC51_46120 [Streptomyces aquilus]